MNEFPTIALAAVDQRHPDGELPNLRTAAHLRFGSLDLDCIGEVCGFTPSDGVECRCLTILVIRGSALQLLDDFSPPASESAERVAQRYVLLRE